MKNIYLRVVLLRHLECKNCRIMKKARISSRLGGKTKNKCETERGKMQRGKLENSMRVPKVLDVVFFFPLTLWVSSISTLQRQLLKRPLSWRYYIKKLIFLHGLIPFKILSFFIFKLIVIVALINTKFYFDVCFGVPKTHANYLFIMFYFLLSHQCPLNRLKFSYFIWCPFRVGLTHSSNILY